MLFKPHGKKSTYVLILLLSVRLIMSAEIAIRGYQLSDIEEFPRHEDPEEEFFLNENQKNRQEKPKKQSEKRSRIVYEEPQYAYLEDESDEVDPKKKQGQFLPYDIDPIDIEDLFMSYYNRLPKRSKGINAIEWSLQHPVYDGSSSLNEYTNDRIDEILSYEDYKRMQKNIIRKRKAEFQSLNQHYANITKTVSKLFRPGNVFKGLNVTSQFLPRITKCIGRDKIVNDTKCPDYNQSNCVTEVDPRHTQGVDQVRNISLLKMHSEQDINPES